MRAPLLASFVLLSALALGQSVLTTAQRLAAAERKAALALDTAWYEKNETADYVEIGKNGIKKTKSRSIAEMKAMGKLLKVKSMTADVLRAKMEGKELVSQVKVHVLATLTDPQGKAHSFDYTETAEDTWTKVGGDWRKRLERTLAEGGTIDGKATP